MHICNVYGLDCLAVLEAWVCGHLGVHFVNEVIILESLGLRCQNFVYLRLKVKFFDLRRLAETHDLVAHVLPAEHILRDGSQQGHLIVLRHQGAHVHVVGD